MSVHVERGVIDLPRVIVVAERRVEPDALVQQRAIGFFELLAIVLR
jgi:hypothetical protein